MRGWLIALAAVAVFDLVLRLLHGELASIRWIDVRAALSALGPTVLGVALAATALSDGALIGYDALALRHLGHRLPWWQVTLTSFIATTLGHNVGMALVSASAVRTRLYTAWGPTSPRGLA